MHLTIANIGVGTSGRADPGHSLGHAELCMRGWRRVQWLMVIRRVCSEAGDSKLLATGGVK